MKNFSLSALPLLMLVWFIAVCFNGTVEAREMIRGNESSSSTPGRFNADLSVPERSNFRRLQTPKAKAEDDSAAASHSAGAADDTAKAPPQKGSTVDQDRVSIADRTSDVSTKKEAPKVEDLGIHFTKPETAPPNTASPTMTKPGNITTTTAPASKQKSLGSNSTSSSTKSSNSNSTTAAPAPAPTRTEYPTAITVGSIASQTSTMDEATHVPNSAGMEFVTPETGAPNNNTYGRTESSSSTSGTTIPSSNSGNTTGKQMQALHNMVLDFVPSVKMTVHYMYSTTMFTLIVGIFPLIAMTDFLQLFFCCHRIG